jgi:transcription elongation factor Elf1
MASKKSKRKIPFTCPICGKGTDRPVEELNEGALIVCPFCNLRLTLHGHMWQEVKDEIEKLNK